MKIAIIGRSGQIASELQQLLPDLAQVFAVGRPEIDLASPASVRRAIRELRPDILVNAAAYTAVDQAEAEPDLAMAINGEAPALMAEESKRLGALFVHYSTDYVYDGSKDSPYNENDGVNPLNVYGASKLAGDRGIEAISGAYLIFRTSWIYGPRGRNFLLTIMKLLTERDELRVVDDQRGAPTSSRDVAEATKTIISQYIKENRGVDGLGDRRGIYNMTTQGSVSWHGFAAAIVEGMRRADRTGNSLARIVPINSGERPAAAARPKNSRLSNEKIYRTFGVRLRDWRISLDSVMEEVARTV